MLTHSQIWSAIDALAMRMNISVSGLAKKAGLDPTTFNKSKRSTNDGRERWPSTESLSKVLRATDSSLEDFVKIVAQVSHENGLLPNNGAESTSYGFSEAEQTPLSGYGLNGLSNNVISVDTFEDYMTPFYRAGDKLLVSKTEDISEGNRVVISLKDGRRYPCVIETVSKQDINVSSLNLDVEKKSFSISDVEWVANILWVSQS